MFSGGPLDYASWKSAFETLIEQNQKQIPPAERIHYLKRYLGGKARESIEGFFLYSPSRHSLKQRSSLTRDLEIHTLFKVRFVISWKATRRFLPVIELHFASIWTSYDSA